jgi:hypothetical protein
MILQQCGKNGVSGVHGESDGGRFFCLSQQSHAFLVTPTLTSLLSVPTNALLLPRSLIALQTNLPHYCQHGAATALRTSTTGSALDLLLDSCAKALAFSQDTAWTTSSSLWAWLIFT